MRTPDEIKKGLACRVNPVVTKPCNECPYIEKCPAEYAVGDAYILIMQLEEKIAKRDKLLAVMGVRIREEDNHGNA